MANFCICRTAKLKTDGNVAGSIAHALRARETPNADPKIENWTNFNKKGEDGISHIPDNVFDQAMARYRKTLPKKIGKGRVPCIELLATVSPEVMARKDFDYVAYLNDFDHWVEDTFGKENVFLKVHHKDEKTPHSSVFVVPKVTKKYKDGHTEEVLAAKQWLGGREKLSKLQDDFFEKVGKKYGLERGIKNSKARHQTQKKYYAKINQLEKELTEFSKNLVENVPNIKGIFSTVIDPEKLNPYLKEQIETLKPYFQKLAKAEDTEKKYKALQSAFNEEVEKKVAEAKEQTNGKNAEEKAKLQEQIDTLNAKLNTTTTTVNYKDGIEIKCEGGILKGLRERADMAYEFKTLTPLGLRDLADRMEALNISGEQAYYQAHKKGLDIGDWLDTPLPTKKRDWSPSRS